MDYLPPPRRRRDRVDPGTFTVTSISQAAYLMLQNLEHASALIERAVTPAEVRDAYRHLSKMRGQLAKYLSMLERGVNAVAVAAGNPPIERIIHLRF